MKLSKVSYSCWWKKSVNHLGCINPLGQTVTVGQTKNLKWWPPAFLHQSSWNLVLSYMRFNTCQSNVPKTIHQTTLQVLALSLTASPPLSSASLLSASVLLQQQRPQRVSVGMIWGSEGKSHKFSALNSPRKSCLFQAQVYKYIQVYVLVDNQYYWFMWVSSDSKWLTPKNCGVNSYLNHLCFPMRLALRLSFLEVVPSFHQRGSGR